MVSARLLPCSDLPEDQPMKPILEMMFAAGEEPVGVRVLAYQSSGAIKRILYTLEAGEVEIIRRSSFGKILEIAEKPVFSGRFARYLLSRQLKTKKKHEVWFRFAGKPVRFSLREFAIVTGLPCGKFPRRSKLKLKETISEKPYWVTLFGKSDVVTVASVIKMLRRKTVTDRDVRIKFACLAILESVLLPTSLKMKICRDHAEAIQDLDEFFSYPWGRLADEVALSQNTIAVKGFALALQLVMVEAVPSLTEVVQESCSSSESDSEEDILHPLWAKKQTQNPAHARTVDMESDAFVVSILDQDPTGVFEDSSVVYSDEEEDETMDNIVDLIQENYKFEFSMFVGGLKKVDVDRLRDLAKPTTKTKKARTRSTKSVDTESGFVVSFVNEHIKPKLAVMETNLSQVSSRIDSIQLSVLGVVESLLEKFKEELMQTVTSIVHSSVREGQSDGNHVLLNNATPSSNCVPANVPRPSVAQQDANEKSIRNVMKNISEYSTPPSSPRQSRAMETLFFFSSAPHQQGRALSAHSQNHTRQIDTLQLSGVDKMPTCYITEMPSFSLGLTQEERMVVEAPRLANEQVNFPTLPDINVAHNMDSQQFSRKSKRQKMVPAALVDDYQCDPYILSRMRRSQRCVFVLYDSRDLQRKFLNLSSQLKRNFVINVGGISVSSKEIQVLAERGRMLPHKVLDLLIRLVRLVVLQPSSVDAGPCYCFLNTKFGSALVRSFPKFNLTKRKESFRFAKCLSEFFIRRPRPSFQQRFYYFPFCFRKQHWVGICFDTVRGHLSVLDCNMSHSDDASVASYVFPIVHMLPYLYRQGMGDIGSGELMPYTYDRLEAVSQHDDPPASGILVVLLMVTHALYGINACKNIPPETVCEEAKSAAVMAYEFKEKL
ncbi:hypothetical protein N665_0123s0023 [Sinapis alba]|nr:hypothetical protein N665_0123s0023 [Sinapis alba]